MTQGWHAVRRVEGCSPQTIILPVLADVVPPIISSPRRLYLANINGKPPAATKIVVRSVVKKKITITRIESQLPLRFTYDTRARNQVEVRITPTVTKVQGRDVQGMLVVHVDGHDPLTVPVFWTSAQEMVCGTKVKQLVERDNSNEDVFESCY